MWRSEGHHFDFSFDSCCVVITGKGKSSPGGEGFQGFL